MGTEIVGALRKKSVADLGRLSQFTIEDPPRTEAFINSLPCVTNLRLDIGQYLQVEDPKSRSLLFGLYIASNQRGNRGLIEEAFLREPHSAVAGGIANNLEFLAKFDQLERPLIEAFLQHVIGGSAALVGDDSAKIRIAQRVLEAIREG